MLTHSQQAKVNWLKLKNAIFANKDQMTVAGQLRHYRSNPPEVFLGKGVVKLHNKFIAEHL